MSLTDIYLRSVKATGKIFEKADRDGMSIRVSAKGHITFQYTFRFESKRQRIKYGSYPTISLKKARDLHTDAKELLADGINPIVHMKEEKAKEQLSETVNDLIKEFMEKYIYKHRKWPEYPERILRVDVAPVIGDMKCKNITGRDITKVLDPILERGSNVQANNTLTILKQMFNYAVERGIIENSPCQRMTKQSVGGKEKSRDRVLSEDEIMQVIAQLPNAKMTESFRIAVLLLLLTGQRAGELIQAKWAHINFEKRLWRIPKGNAKNEKEHILPLGSMAIELFESLKEYSGEGVYVFAASSYCDNEHAERRSLTRAIIRGQKTFGIEHWTLHDLRRTAATHMNGLNIQPHVIERILNHAMPGVMGVYNRYSYEAEMREALEIWGERVRLLASDYDNVEILKAS